MTETDVIVIGAGPIGLEVASTLKRAGVDYLHFDEAQIGSTIQCWPKNTPFFSSPERVAIAGLPIQSIDQNMLTGEAYLAYLRGVVETLDLQINTYQRVRQIERTGNGFLISSLKNQREIRYGCKKLVLATGDMNSNHRLGIPGEDLPHVKHTFDDPHTYFQNRLLVVGGRNSAIEAAIRCWRAGARVTISYRRAAFDRAHVNSRYHLEIGILVRKGYIEFLPQTELREITPDSITFEKTATGERSAISADFVMLLTGYEADLTLLEQVGAQLTDEDSAPEYDRDTMETSVPGVYVAGTVCSGRGRSHRHLIGTAHEHARRIAREMTGKSTEAVGTIPSRAYPFTHEDLDPVSETLHTETF